MKIHVSIVLDGRSIRDYNKNIVVKEVITDRSPEEYVASLYRDLSDDSKFIFISDAVFNKNYIVTISAYEAIPNYNSGFTGARPVYEG